MTIIELREERVEEHKIITQGAGGLYLDSGDDMDSEEHPLEFDPDSSFEEMTSQFVGLTGKDGHHSGCEDDQKIIEKEEDIRMSLEESSKPQG